VLVDFRNIITHEYFGIDCDEVWNIVLYNLEPLRNEIEQDILNLPNEIFDKLIFYIIDENKHIDFIFGSLLELKKLKEF
jgi:hypothetical protein